MTDGSTEGPVSCAEFVRQLYHFQADELPEVERRRLDEHLEICPACARRLEVEDGLLGAIKSRLHRVPPPPGLETRVREALRREAAPESGRGAWIRAPWLVPAAAAVVLALVLFPGLRGRSGHPPGAPAGVVQVDREVTVVDLECDRSGRSVAQQRSCSLAHHLNALKLAEGGYWSVSLDEEGGRRLVVDHEMRGHVLHVKGDLYTRIRTLRLTELTDLGLGGLAARFALPRDRRPEL